MGAGFLGMSYSPFVIQDPNAPIANLRLPKDVVLPDLPTDDAPGAQ